MQTTYDTFSAAGGNSLRTKCLEDGQIERVKGQQPLAQASVLSVASNLWNTIMGGGISLIALPAAAQSSGLALFPFLVILLSGLTAYVCDLLVVGCEKTGAHDYTSLIGRALGPSWMVFVDICMFLFLLGTCASLLEASITCILPIVAGSFATWSVVGTAITLGIICTASSLDAIAPLSQFAFVLVIVFICFVVYASSTTMSHTLPPVPITWWPASVMGFFNSISLLTFSFICMYNVLPIYSEMREPKRQGWLLSLPLAMVACTTFFLMAGIFPAIAHPGNGNSIIVQYATCPFGQILSFLFGVSFIVSIPLYQWIGTRAGLTLGNAIFRQIPFMRFEESALREGGERDAAGHEDWHGLPLQLGYFAFAAVTLVVTLLVDNVDFLITVTTAVSAVPVMFIVPPLAWAALLRQGHLGDSCMHGFPLACFVVALGIAVWCGCLYSLRGTNA
jgi:amino acid permease